MSKKFEVLLELPAGGNQISSTEEVCDHGEARFIRKTIRYSHGVEIILLKDFQNSLFSVQLRSRKSPLWIKGNQVLKIV